MRFYFCTFDDEKLEEDVALELDLYNLALDILKGRIFLGGNKAMEMLVCKLFGGVDWLGTVEDGDVVKF